MSWLRRAGDVGQDGIVASVTPEAAGWEYSGLEVLDFGESRTFTRTMASTEGVLLPLSARDVEVRVDGERYSLDGRDGVFAAVSDWIYLPLGSNVEFSAGRGEIALCTAKATVRHDLAVTAAASVPVEVRGAGAATRQVTNIATPTSFAGADRINVCEVITPAGNFSSWPPHRHDGIAGCPVRNEEIYYFRTGCLDSPHGDARGQAQFRVYTVDGVVDETVTVLDQDVYLVPEGYHGPSTAPPQYPLYFLNVLAGPGNERTMGFCDDPTHAWIRASWDSAEQDPRCPVTSASGRVSR
ncbi:5-deoxy-glucuronate isomerase [Nocardioides mesophilus]|uniref:5-deoxy-glucuronate isomerase n=1 Tax=Nocardioides mesophilus TaxID=433659 RepID=A0A7G9RFM4_9ACTN|nr:5-deoxy-glucuronate isomerase [Nocardioides mesophilus]QNN54399.1 5-deoxy-glucuronate isomerase [Nocardioides mesophilus]